MGPAGLPWLAFGRFLVTYDELNDSSGKRLPLGLFHHQGIGPAFDDALTDHAAFDNGNDHRPIWDGVSVDGGAANKYVRRRLLGLDGRRASP